MDRRGKSAVVPAAVAAVLWAVIEIVAGQLSSAVRPLVLSFHFSLWAGLTSFLVLVGTGRTADLSIFKKNETLFLVLLATGGYGLWLLQGLTLEMVPQNTGRIIFYASPLAMALLAFFGRESPSGRRVGNLLLGFVGAALLLAFSSGGSAALPGAGGWGGYGVAVGWALCWALFGVMLRQLGRRFDVLAAITIVLAAGAVCMLATCVAGRIDVFALTAWQLILCAAAGASAGVGAFYLWATAVSRAPVVTCAPLWYVAPACVACFRVWRNPGWPSWGTLVGFVLLVFALRSSIRMSAETSRTLGDILREE